MTMEMDVMHSLQQVTESHPASPLTGQTGGISWVPVCGVAAEGGS